MKTNDRPSRVPELRLLPAGTKTVVLSGLFSALLVLPAGADEPVDITTMLRAGRHAEALQKTDAYLASNPHDPQLRFLKGVILAEQNKSAEAIVVFSKLTEDFPTLPEPHNNLAVLYAASGQYEKARIALDAAIRTNPAYATAYENLGDVHAKLASQAYDKALQLDSGSTTAKSKLTMMRNLIANVNAGSAVQVVAMLPPPPNEKPASQFATQLPAWAVVPPLPTPSTPVVAVKQPEPAAGESQVDPIATRDEVLNVVAAWAQAWASQNMADYLGFYGKDFRTPNGVSRKAWEEQRRARIVGKSGIRVAVERPEVKLDGDTATIRFHQIYSSDQYTWKGSKTLVLSKRSGKWQIRQEHAGS